MLKFTKFMDESVDLDESLRKDIAQLSAKFPEGSKVRCKKSGKTGKVLTVGKDFIKVAVDGGKQMDYKPDELVSLKEEVELDERVNTDKARKELLSVVQHVKSAKSGLLKLSSDADKLLDAMPNGTKHFRSLQRALMDADKIADSLGDSLRNAQRWDAKLLEGNDEENESVELDEISKKTLGSYVKKAGASMASHGVAVGSGRNTEKSSKAMANRMKGMNRAADRLTKEEAEQIDELDAKTYRSYHDKATADQLKRMSKDKRSKEDQRIMRKRSLGISTAGMKQYGDKRTMSQRIRGEEVSEAAKNIKHPAHDALMKLAKSRDAGSDAKDYMVAAGKLDNFTATGNRGVLSDLVKLLRNMDSYPRDAVLWTIKKYDESMFKSLSSKM